MFVLVVFLLFHHLGAAIPLAAISSDPPPTWTLLLQRDCHVDTSCTFRLYLHDDPFVLPKICTFNITSPDTTPAAHIAFQNIGCDSSSIPLPLAISSGWDPKGFIVLTVLNKETRKYALFGFIDEVLANDGVAPPVTSNVVESPVPAPVPAMKRQVSDSGTSTAKSPLDNAPTWELTNVMRFIDLDHRFVTFSFMIQSYNIAPVVCSAQVDAQEHVDILTMSFYAAKCVGIDWTISWGYMPDNDGAVMTVVNPQRTRKAFFGWDNVNEGVELGDVGPNQTYELRRA